MKPFKVALIGNVNDTYAPHFKASERLTELQQSFPFTFDWIPTEVLREDTSVLASYAGIWAGSGPYQSKEGVINGIRFARQNNIPFLGTCSGFGYAVLEFAQHVFALDTVFHPHEGLVIPDEQLFLDKLASCGIGMYDVSFTVRQNTQAQRLYKTQEPIQEISHCSYGIHPNQIEVFSQNGMIVSAVDAAGEAKIMEYVPNNLFLILLFYPQLRAGSVHPIIRAFVEAAAAGTKAVEMSL